MTTYGMAYVRASFVRGVLIAALAVSSIGCGSSGNDKKRRDGGQGADAVIGYWTGDWGDMVLRVVGDEMWGTYTHDEGTLRGQFANGVFTGWWSEVPSRLPTGDAGEVQFTFIEPADGGGATIDGRWRYGDAVNEPAWRENWDLSAHSSDPEPAALAARFSDPSLFHAHP